MQGFGMAVVVGWCQTRGKRVKQQSESKLTSHLRLRPPYTQSSAHTAPSACGPGGPSASSSWSWTPTRVATAARVNFPTAGGGGWVVEETERRRGPFFTSSLTSSKPILSGCFLGTRTYLEGITGGFRTARREGGRMQKMAAVRWAGGPGGRNREAGCKGAELHPRTHRWPLGGSARSCRPRPAKCGGLAAARASSRTSLCCTHTFGPLRKAHKARAVSSRSVWHSWKLGIAELWNTCHASGVGKHDDVIERPAILWVRRVKGQLPGCFLSEVYQHGGVHHGNCKAAFSQLLPHGYVGRGALVVALGRQPEGNFTAKSREARWTCLTTLWNRYLGGHPTPEVGVRRSRIQHRRDDRLVLLHELPQHIRVGEEVVAVSHLHGTDRRDRSDQPERLGENTCNWNGASLKRSSLKVKNTPQSYNCRRGENLSDGSSLNCF